MSGTSSPSFHFLALTLICVLGAIIYSNTFESPFHFDDRPNIEINSHVKIDELNFASLYDAAVESIGGRPVAFVSFALNYYHGKLNVQGYHRVNLLVHLASGVLVYFLALCTYQLFLKSRDSNPLASRNIEWMALFAACLFVAHPLQTQAVTYIVQRMTSMAAMFYFLSLLLYIRGRLTDINSRRWLFWGGSCLAGLLAIGSKQIAATLPIAIGLYEWYFFQDLSTKWVRHRIGYLIGLVMLLGLIVLVMLGPTPAEWMAESYSKRDFTVGQRLLTQPRVVVFYLSLIFWPLPSRLNLLHDVSTSQSLLEPITTLLSILTIVGLVALAIRFAHKERLVSFGIMWFFLNLVIESSILPLEMIYEHRIYLPLFGLVLIIPYALQKWLSLQAVTAAALAAVLVVLLGIGAHQRNSVWQTKLGLWSDVVEKSPNLARGISSRGNSYRELGNREQALADFSRAIELKPDHAVAYENRANIFGELRQFERALQDYSEAIRYSPDNAPTYFNRGQVYQVLGKRELAIADFEKAVEINSIFYPAYNKLAWLLATHPDADQRDGVKALSLAKKACEETKWQIPKYLETYAAACAETGDFPEAARQQDLAIRLAGNKRTNSMIDRLKLYRLEEPYRK